MVLYEISSLRLLGEVNILSNTLCKSLTLCILILRNKIAALVIINDIRDSEIDKECLDEALLTALVCETCVTLILYFWVTMKLEIHREFFIPKRKSWVLMVLLHWLDILARPFALA